MTAVQFKEKQILVRHVKKCHVDIYKLGIHHKIY